MDAVKAIISIISFVIGLAILFGIMRYFGIDVVNTIVTGFEDLRETFIHLVRTF